jgi:hypothetical protein
VIAKGGGRVWYVDEGGPHRSALENMIRQAMVGGVESNDDVWLMTPLVDRTAANYHFEWEREWRIPGGLEFTPDDVAFLFVPEHLHEAARQFLDTGGYGNGPSYLCPILDPLWPDDKIQAALKDVPSP